MADRELQSLYDDLERRVFDLHERGRFAEALPAAERMCELVAEHSGGTGTADYASCLNLVAELYHEMGRFSEAEERYQRCIEIRRATLGPEHPLLALSLNNLGHLCRGHGRLARAEALHREALAIRRRALPEDDPDIGTSLNNLAVVLHAQGRHEESEAAFRSAIELRRRALGESHPDLATSLNDCALLYLAGGRYEEAEALYEEALEIWRAGGEQTARRYTAGLNNLAMLYRALGRYQEAVRLHLEGLDVVRTMLGEAHPEVLISLNNLAEVYRELGQLAQAESLLLRVLELGQPTLGEDTPALAVSLNNLAAVYRASGRYAEAEPLYRQAAEIRRTALGEDHPDYAASLSNLALLRESKGELAEAQRLHEKALAIRRRALGEDHPSYAIGLNNLGVLYRTLGEHAKAEPLYRQALDIRRRALGEGHPSYAESLSNLALLCAATDRPEQAIELMQRAVSVHGKVLGTVFAFSSESACWDHLRSIRSRLQALLSLIWEHREFLPGAGAMALDLLLGRKALAAEATAAQREVILRGRHPDLEPQLRALTVLRRRIAGKAVAGPAPGEELSAHERTLRAWAERRETLEAALARQVPALGLERRLQAADHRTVARSLPEGAVLVELFRLEVVDPKARAERISDTLWRLPEQWKPARYLAFVLQADPATEPSVDLVDLGEARRIEEKITAFRDRVVATARHFEVEEGPPGADLEAVSHELRSLVFDPLVPMLRGRRRIFVAPDAALNLLPFETLPEKGGGHLIDSYRISYLSSGRDALRFGAPRGAAREAVVVADPDYDLGSSEGDSRDAGAVTAGAPPARGLAGELMRQQIGTFRRLPATAVEGRSVAALLGTTQVWLRRGAVDGRLKSVRSPRVLHVATHGFFLADRPHEAGEPRRLGLRSLRWEGSGTWSVAGLPNPLLRSGLALAGVNSWLRGRELPPEAEDGVLTAEDVAGMDLLDSELVVLSACETGVGEVRNGEGVFGLRRAFVLAGARTLVMSLWKVPDVLTRELMEAFYAQLLESVPRAEALRKAQLTIKERHPDPLSWGAFICQGDPAPMELAAG